MTELAELKTLMAASIRALVGAYLDAARVDASFEIMGVDTQLIEDGTYFVVECDGRIVGCGGWSRRATLFGGDHSAGRSARHLDPATEPARVRAMYTHPDFVRRGIGRLVLSLCEAAATREGFHSLELVATTAGEPLYRACGFETIERIEVPTSTPVTVPCARMRKSITSPLTIRKGELRDLDAIKICIDEAYASYTPRIGKRPASMDTDFRPLLRDGLVWVLELDGAVVGLMVLIETPEAFEIRSVAVRPARQRHGLGRYLMSHAESLARQTGRATLRLYTNARIPELVTYYSKLGYDEEERKEEHGYHRVFMIKRLK